MIRSFFCTIITGTIFILPCSIIAEGEATQVLRAIFPVTCVSPGLASGLAKRFETEYGTPVKVISLCTGDAITFVKEHEGTEDVDVMLGHDRDAEEQFINDGYAVNLRSVCLSDFVLVGPKDDPAKIGGLTDAVKALKKIAKSGSFFCSRADSSGTHALEMHLWKKAGIKPKGNWYIKTKVGTSETLLIAARKKAYFISHWASFSQMLETVDLVPLVEDGKQLFTSYEVMALNPERFPDVNYITAMLFIGFLTSPAVQKYIAGYGVKEFGRAPFKPLAVKMNTLQKGK